VSEELLRRMERTVRRFGGPLPIDDLLPELDAESGVFLSSTGPEEGDEVPRVQPLTDFRRQGPRPLADSSDGEIDDLRSRSVDPNVD
jgi:hypothetical protein